MPGSRHSHPVFARFYAAVGPAMEQAGAAELRSRLLTGLSGRVIEVGAGDGMNFTHYPPEVTSVLAVEPEPYLRRLAEGKAAKAPVRVEVVDGIAEQIPAADGSFDAAVTSLVLCSVRDQRVALAEIHRVLKPGGQLRFLEHVRAQTPVRLGVQSLAAPVWPVLFGGCRLKRDTETAIASAGFKIDHLDRLLLPDVQIPVPSAPHILGTASRQ